MIGTDDIQFELGVVLARKFRDCFECLGRGGTADDLGCMVLADVEPVVKDEARNEDSADRVDEPCLREVMRDGRRYDGERVSHNVVFVIFGQSFCSARNPGQGAGVEVEGDLDADGHDHDAYGDGLHVWEKGRKWGFGSEMPASSGPFLTNDTRSLSAVLSLCIALPPCLTFHLPNTGSFPYPKAMTIVPIEALSNSSAATPIMTDTIITPTGSIRERPAG